MTRDALIRLLAHPLIYGQLLLIALGLAVAAFWDPRPPAPSLPPLTSPQQLPGERSILIGAATVIAIKEAGPPTVRSMCAEGCYERYAMLIERLTLQHVAKVGTGGYIDADLTYQPSRPAGAPRQAITIRFRTLPERNPAWSVDQADEGWFCGFMVVVTEGQGAPGSVETGEICTP